MQEILPGLFHWTTFHDGIAARVSSYYLESAGALIDPRVPDEGLDAFAGRDRPQQVVLTSGLHARHAERFAEAFGCVIRASPEALERLDGSLDAQRYSAGDEIAPGIVAIHIGKLSPDEYALQIAVAEGAIAFADGLVRYGEALGFVSDALIGENADAIKAGLKDAFRGLLTRDFDHLLFAHGDRCSVEVRRPCASLSRGRSARRTTARLSERASRRRWPVLGNALPSVPRG